MKYRFLLCWSIFSLSLLSFGGFVASSSAQKLSPQEIITKHFASIGEKGLVAESKRLMAVGESEFHKHQPPQTAVGRAVLASNGVDMAFFSTFNADNYSMERIGLFGDKVNIPVVKLGSRSPLGAFLKSYDETLDGRIFGGCIFSTWLLLDPSSADRFETDGKKKIDGRDAWVLNFKPKKGLTSGSYVKLYFDAENFHHLRTVFREQQPDRAAGQDTAGTSSRGGLSSWNNEMANNGFTLTENFGDFHSDKSLTLPHKYSINLVIDGSAGTSQLDWNISIEEYRLIKEFPSGFFSFSETAAK